MDQEEINRIEQKQFRVPLKLFGEYTFQGIYRNKIDQDNIDMIIEYINHKVEEIKQNGLCDGQKVMVLLFISNYIRGYLVSLLRNKFKNQDFGIKIKGNSGTSFTNNRYVEEEGLKKDLPQGLKELTEEMTKPRAQVMKAVGLLLSHKQEHDFPKCLEQVLKAYANQNQRAFSYILSVSKGIVREELRRILQEGTLLKDALTNAIEYNQDAFAAILCHAKDIVGDKLTQVLDNGVFEYALEKALENNKSAFVKIVVVSKDFARDKLIQILKQNESLLNVAKEKLGWFEEWWSAQELSDDYGNYGYYVMPPDEEEVMPTDGDWIRRSIARASDVGSSTDSFEFGIYQ